MTRITSTVLIMLLLINGAVGIAEASGLSEDLGVSVTTGVDQQLNQTVQEMKKGFSPNVNIIESFVSLALASVRVFQTVVEAVFVAPPFMINLLGGGSLITTVVYAMMAPMYVIALLEILYLAVGNDML